jgi:hypothetical protein
MQFDDATVSVENGAALGCASRVTCIRGGGLCCWPRKPAARGAPRSTVGAGHAYAGDHRGIRLVDPFPGTALRSLSILIASRPCSGGCQDPECVVPLCWLHHRAYDTGRLELLPHLEPRWRAEVAHAVLHLGLVGAYCRLGRRRA